MCCVVQHGADARVLDALGARVRPPQRGRGPRGRFRRVRAGEARREDARVPRRARQGGRRTGALHHR